MSISEKTIHALLDDELAAGLALDCCDIRTWAPDEIVVDLLRFDEGCKGIDSDAIHPHVISWLAKQREPGHVVRFWPRPRYEEITEEEARELGLI